MEFSNLPNELVLYGTLFSLNNRIQSIGDDFLSEITMKQHFLLMTLDLFKDSNPTLKEVADIIGCSYQNIKRMATALEKKGYLKIERDNYDKRKYNLIKTNKIQTVSNEIQTEINQFIETLYKNISAEELMCVLEVLEQMNKNLKEAKECNKI